MLAIFKHNAHGSKAPAKFARFLPPLKHARTNSAKALPKDGVKKSIFISQSTDIYVNLALEHWLYRNSDLSKQHVLLLWRSDPCVVIGRHQNPWIECNIPVIESSQIVVARRNSGGGAVYHDIGNLNLSFFTPRERYDRTYNLNIIKRALFREWNLESIINKKDDIIVEGKFKVSGTAAKLGHPNAYHHCTLLVNVNKEALSLALDNTYEGIATNATKSASSPIRNLTEMNCHVEMDRLLSAIGWEYLRGETMTLHDEHGQKFFGPQQRGFQMLNPTEDWFPGIEKILEEFRGWDWIYGKSPTFTVTRILQARDSFIISRDDIRPPKLVISIEKGIVQDATLTLPSNVSQYESLIANLSGKRFSYGLVNNTVRALRAVNF